MISEEAFTKLARKAILRSIPIYTTFYDDAYELDDIDNQFYLEQIEMTEGATIREVDIRNAFTYPTEDGSDDYINIPYVLKSYEGTFVQKLIYENLLESKKKAKQKVEESAKNMAKKLDLAVLAKMQEAAVRVNEGVSDKKWFDIATGEVTVANINNHLTVALEKLTESKFWLPEGFDGLTLYLPGRMMIAGKKDKSEWKDGKVSELFGDYVSKVKYVPQLTTSAMIAFENDDKGVRKVKHVDAPVAMYKADDVKATFYTSMACDFKVVPEFVSDTRVVTSRIIEVQNIIDAPTIKYKNGVVAQ